MTDEPNLIANLKAILRPHGNGKIVAVRSELYVDDDFIAACLEDLERKSKIWLAIHEDLTALDQLALMVLINAAGLDRKL